MSDNLPSLAQRGFARPSIVQTPGGAGIGGLLFPSPHTPLMAGSPLLAPPLPLPTSPIASPGSGQKAGYRAVAPRKLAMPPFQAQPTSPPSINARAKASATTPITPSPTAAAEPTARGWVAPGVGSG